MKDKLDLMIQRQMYLQQLLKVNIHSQEYKEKMILAACSELMEALKETPWKPWKIQ